jgi:hypothetical protein
MTAIVPDGERRWERLGGVRAGGLRPATTDALGTVAEGSWPRCGPEGDKITQ